MDAPWPLVEIAIEPTSKADTARLTRALVALAEEDASLVVSLGAASGQIVLAGASELHLDLAVMRLRDEHDLAVAYGAPQVAYRETLTRRVETDYTHRKQTFGAGEFAHVKLIFEPDATATGTRFVSMMVDGAMPTSFVAGVEAGIASVAGVLAGFPLRGVRATLVNAAYHEVDSSAPAFEIAARSAFREALRVGSVLLEPIMHVTVMAPEDYKGAVTDDMDARGRVLEHGRRGDVYVVAGLAPLANMFGYKAQLRALTQGRGSYAMRFDHTQPMPPSDDGRPPPAAAMALQA